MHVPKCLLKWDVLLAGVFLALGFVISDWLVVALAIFMLLLAVVELIYKKSKRYTNGSTSTKDR